jgi:ATP-binding protein involved in chromosome partitioning
MSHNGVTREAIIEALKSVVPPGTDNDVVTLQLVRGVGLENGVATVSYEIPSSASQAQGQIRQATLDAVSKLGSLKSVNVEFSVRPPARGTTNLPGVRHVVAVGAGKGGVGKSTVAALLAVGLHRLGFKTGLLDADVYGPSLPKIMGMEGMQPRGDAEGRIIPPEIDGIPCMSMGFLVPPEEAIVWRGPMAQKYVKEFLDRGAWGELDYLIVDLPPGTGDIPLTLAQSIPLSGAVVVCTPQDLALLDCVKALRMYRKLDVEIIGVVENMSYYLCPKCGHREEIFSTGGAEKAAKELDAPFLGGIPLNIKIRTHGDAGAPLSNFTKTDPYVREAIEQVVRNFVERLESQAKKRTPLPQLRITD